MAAFFRDNPDIAREFKGLVAGTAAFNAKWKELSRRDPKGFEAAQDRSAAKLWYAPARDAYAKAGFDLSNRGVQEAVFSSSIQHGGVVSKLLPLIKKLAGGRDISKLSPQEQIRLIYQGRERYQPAYASRYRREADDALKMSHGIQTSAVLVRQNPPVQQAAAVATAPVAPPVPQRPAPAAPMHPANVPQSAAKVAPAQQSAHVLVQNGRIGHVPVSRTVSNAKIAWMASGGLVKDNSHD